MVAGFDFDFSLTKDKQTAGVLVRKKSIPENGGRLLS
jgi:hypothetical protein